MKIKRRRRHKQEKNNTRRKYEKRRKLIKAWKRELQSNGYEGLFPRG
jgi:hypothetical protein